MSDPWINRLVVSGPAAEVRAFQTSAASGEGPSQTSLSFTRLQAQLPAEGQHGLDAPVEPWDDSSASNPSGVSAPETQARQIPGMTRLVYRFSLDGYEPDTLLIRVSKLFLHLCFVLGWVAPSVDDQTSRFIHNGHTLVYHASDRQKVSLRAKAYRRYGLSVDAASESTDDGALWADVEADWALLDTVVKHWDGKVGRTLKRIQQSASLLSSTS